MSETIKSYKDLVVWQKAYELVKMVYGITSKLPKEELFVLVTQTRRSAVSIVSNIAEGVNRRTRKDYANFLKIAYGSISELETQLLLCRDMYDINIDKELVLIVEVSKMIRVLIGKLETKN